MIWKEQKDNKLKVKQYDTNSLRKIIRKLEKENIELKKQLKTSNIVYDEQTFFDESILEKEEFDLDQGARINKRFITIDLARDFYKFFWGRQDVYAKRSKKGGYFPQCENRWKSCCPKQNGFNQSCSKCEYKSWMPLTPDKVMAHLIGYNESGADAIGVYPLFPNNTCRFLVFDFDNHQKDAEKNDFANESDIWQSEVDALRIICTENQIPNLVERSKSGKGAHLWIFFDKPLVASIARNFGSLLLEKGSTSVNLQSFNYFDRMYPSQDEINELGSLIALPLQGRALLNGNSAFVDENWNAYPDQWKTLLNTERLSQEKIEGLIYKWNKELNNDSRSPDLRPKPWKKNIRFNKDDVVEKMSIVLADGIYVDALNLMPRIQNQIRALAAFDNPVFYKNKRLGYSNFYNFSSVYLGKDINGYIKIPRGLLERLIELCEESGIEFEIVDEREKGIPIRVAFNGSLKTQQELATDKMLRCENGILSATTAFGKTVVGSYLIAARKVNCLIIVQNKELLNQWVDELGKFLTIDEEPPVYETKTGRMKKRDSVIGILQGNKKALTGIIDVAMVGSLKSKDEWNEKINTYGMVIFDECHHAASNTAVEILQHINAKYVYGTSATVKRSDELERIITMLIGPMRFSYTAKERAKIQGIIHLVYPRYTAVSDTPQSRNDINTAFSLISDNEDRNNQIVEDVKECIMAGRTPVVLTKQKIQAKILYDKLKEEADKVFLLYGDNTDKENANTIKEMKNTSKEDSLILIATGQKIGEGFDFPRLDTLMLASPVSFEGRLEQYVGRLNREYEGKVDVKVYDYVDSHIRYFDRMFLKRLKAYKKIGYNIAPVEEKEKQIVNSIFDATNYVEVFERDIIESEKSILISSPILSNAKVERFIAITKKCMQAGVKISVITIDPDSTLDASATYYFELINKMKTAGMKVFTKKDVTEHFAIFDNKIVWHGGANLLGNIDGWDNLIRICSDSIANELLNLSVNDDWEEWDFTD